MNCAMPCDPFEIVRMFERALCEYTGAPYCVATTSCTTALLLACVYHEVETVELPKLTYVGVAQSVINAGGKVRFRDENWSGEYRLDPYPIWDCARWLRGGMYRPGTMMCLSFHWSKHLSIGQGGAILHDDPEADEWLRRARFDGRGEGVPAGNDRFTNGWHAYMMPRDAAEGLTRLALLPGHNDPLPNSDYPDLSMSELFR